MTVQRVSRNDLTQLLCEAPNAPMQTRAVLRLAEPVDRDAIRTVRAQGLTRVRGLRQRLVATPLGLAHPNRAAGKESFARGAAVEDHRRAVGLVAATGVMGARRCRCQSATRR